MSGSKEERMRISLLGALLVAGLVIASMAARTFSESVASATVDFPRAAPSGDLISHMTEADGGQVITVIDPRSRVMAVYHVDRTSGEILLKSARNITWDLQMTDYNTGELSPKDIRSGLER